ncbi:uncharacterized protein LOC130979520 [Arachis stenosperma]|uniref:uncharacterized protein LOC130979520 n=1 Tax=Arachis stenosperma TaxID=217475 RepID=UPI0025AC6F89|nr:uncharacterized protein LOC130979520 [Arachis stenosperma]
MFVSLGCLLNLTGRSQRLLKGSMLIEFSTLCYSPHHIDIDFEMNSIPRSCGDVRSLRRQLMEEQEQALELIEMQRRRLAALQFAQNSLSISLHFCFSTNGMRTSEDHFNFNFHLQESFKNTHRKKYRV